MTVLVRESAQNTWDARQATEVRYMLDIRELTAAEHSQWKRHMTWTSRGLGEHERSLLSFFRSSNARVLFVSDRGTVGLGGPTRADQVAEGQRNWLSFVLNSGERRDVDGGGGTYGYGKGCFFILSRARTIVIFSRFVDTKGRLRSRLIASALLSQHDYQGVPFTGRHWWGEPRDSHCEPLTDEVADRTARLLGMPPFIGFETGTTIAVMDPDLTNPALPDDDFSQMSIPEAGRYLADAAAWNLWPLMLAERVPRLTVSVTANGSAVQVPDETSDAALAHFAQAYRNVRDGQGSVAWAGSNKEVIGRLDVVRTMGADIQSLAARELGLEGSPHHVCAMRLPELVVRYVPGRPREVAALGYAGVFRSVDSLDDVYARSEPPTHDAWIDSQLAGREAMIIRSTHRRIAEACDQIAVVLGRSAQHVGDSTAGVAYHLGGLLEGLSGGGADAFGGADDGFGDPTQGPHDGADSTAAGGKGLGGGRHLAKPSYPAIRPTGGTSIEESGGLLILRRRFHLRGTGVVSGSAVVVTAEGGIERERPAGTVTPEILGWQVDGFMHVGTTLQFEFPEVAEVFLCAVPIPDAVVQLEARRA